MQTMQQLYLFCLLSLTGGPLVSSCEAYVLGSTEGHPPDARHHHFGDGDAVSSAAKVGLGLAREGGGSEGADPSSPQRQAKEEPQNFWRKLKGRLNKLTGRDSSSMAARVQGATDAAGAMAKGPLKKVKEYGESAQEAGSQLRDTAEGARLEAATQAEAAAEMAKEAGGKSMETAKEKAEHAVEAASSASNVAAAKAADAGEPLDESLRKAAEAPKHATVSAADAVQKGAQTVEQQAESLRKWGEEKKQEL